VTESEFFTAERLAGRDPYDLRLRSQGLTGHFIAADRTPGEVAARIPEIQ
jgi:hypothetical protein